MEKLYIEAAHSWVGYSLKPEYDADKVKFLTMGMTHAWLYEAYETLEMCKVSPGKEFLKYKICFTESGWVWKALRNNSMLQLFDKIKCYRNEIISMQ